MAKAGFRKIDNDTFKALIAAGLAGAGYQVVLAIIDRTLGFRKGSGYKEKAKIPLAYFERETGLSRQSVRLAIKQAEKRRIILKERNSTRTSIYALNLDSGKWLARKRNHPSELGNEITPGWETKSPQTRKLAIASCMPAKETLKETLKDKGYDKEKGTAINGGNELKGTVMVEDTGITPITGNVYPSGKSHAPSGLTSLTDKGAQRKPNPVAPTLPLKKPTPGDIIAAHIRTHGSLDMYDVPMDWDFRGSILLNTVRNDPRFIEIKGRVYMKDNIPMKAAKSMDGSPPQNLK